MRSFIDFFLRGVQRPSFFLARELATACRYPYNRDRQFDLMRVHLVLLRNESPATIFVENRCVDFSLSYFARSARCARGLKPRLHGQKPHFVTRSRSAVGLTEWGGASGGRGRAWERSELRGARHGGCPGRQPRSLRPNATTPVLSGPLRPEALRHSVSQPAARARSKLGTRPCKPTAGRRAASEVKQDEWIKSEAPRGARDSERGASSLLRE